MLWLAKSNKRHFQRRFTFNGSSTSLEDRNGFAVLLCVSPLRVQSSILALNMSHAKATPKATWGFGRERSK